MYLQKNFHKMFPWIHIMSTIGSVFASFPVAWDVTEYLSNSTNCAVNQNMFLLVSDEKSLRVIMVVSFVAFLLLFSSSLSIIISLYRHIKRMKTNMQYFSYTSCDVHVRGTETVASLFAANALYYFTLLLCASFKDLYIWQCVIAIVLSLTRAPRPLILIRTTARYTIAKNWKGVQDPQIQEVINRFDTQAWMEIMYQKNLGNYAKVYGHWKYWLNRIRNNPADIV
ncbi:hypothetical protein XELAEV_18040198mg [Xenopus laevis]|uniref:Uncharacterized protein n=1 Tax=Xenopus laevis TaxID=8355 RepID=A0A974C903_XENLA|nr:hypothetical protein XELAEV_18040198mg [Xenopus laevis]